MTMWPRWRLKRGAVWLLLFGFLLLSRSGGEDTSDVTDERKLAVRLKSFFQPKESRVQPQKPRIQPQKSRFHPQKSRIQPQKSGFQPQKSGSNQCWIYTHLQKAGGTTIKKIMGDHWGKRRIIFDSPQWKAGDIFIRDFARKVAKASFWSSCAGGYTEALRATVGNSCKWFTMFRHPVSRLISAYYYCKQLPGDWLCASKIVRASEVDIVTFARHWGNFALRQFALNMVKASEVIRFVKDGGVKCDKEEPLKLPGWYLLRQYLEHKGNATGGDENTMLMDMLHPVRDLLSNNFTAVGIIEEFEVTLDLYNVALDVPGLDWKGIFGVEGIRNSNKQFSEEKRATLREAWTNADIKDYISLDILLYEHAQAVFRSQTELHGLV